MNVLFASAKVKPTAVTEIEAVGNRVFEALERDQPQGFRYMTCRLPDGVTYINLWELIDGVDNPLSNMPEARAFQEVLKTGMAEPPTYEQVAVVGSYRFFSKDAK